MQIDGWFKINGGVQGIKLTPWGCILLPKVLPDIQISNRVSLGIPKILKECPFDIPKKYRMSLVPCFFKLVKVTKEYKFQGFNMILS